jgi:hypothetical protein
LPFGWGGYYLGLVVDEIFPDCGAKEFDVTIAVEALGERAGGTAKMSDC